MRLARFLLACPVFAACTVAVPEVPPGIPLDPGHLPGERDHALTRLNLGRPAISP